MANTSPKVNFAAPRGFARTFKSKSKETFFPDDPFGGLRNEKLARKSLKTLQYFIPVFDWLPKYNFNKLKFDLLAGITITSLAIPQGISYAKLVNLPPIIGLCKLIFVFVFDIFYLRIEIIRYGKYCLVKASINVLKYHLYMF